MFLRRHGTISCTVTGRRRRSADLVQGGLEIPCTLLFTGDRESIDKMKQLVEKVDIVISDASHIKEENEGLPLSKKRRS